jgi:hypothetical protein
VGRLWVALLAVSLAAAPAGEDTARLERVAALGKLWAAVKYFHPALAYRDLDWDRALLDALPGAAAASSPGAYAAAVGSMLSVLGDPATRVLPATPAKPAGAFELIRWVGRGTLVATVNPATVNGDAARRLAAAVDQSRAVVFDLRRPQAWPGAESSRVGRLFVAAGLNARLAAGIHSGLAAPWDGGSVYYHSAFYVRDGALIEGNAAAPERPVVFLVDRTSALPPIAPALQSAGKARIVAEGGVSDASLVDRTLMALPGGVRVELRTTELVYDDGATGLVADLTVPETGDALQAAVTLAMNPGPAPPPTRPRLPPYAVPRREDSYPAAEFPSPELRTLAVFRIWSAFEYFHAYRPMMDADWDRALVEALRAVERASGSREYALALARMLAATGDSHVAMRGSRAFNEFLGVARPPVETRIIEGLPVITQAPQGSGLSPGDVVERVDGEAAADRIARLKPYFAASTPQSLDHTVQQVWLNGQPGSAAAIEVRDAAGRLRRAEVPRNGAARRGQRGGPVVTVLGGCIGYVDLDRLAPAGVEAMFDELKDTRAIIFDMRGYPQGTGWLIAPRLASQKQVAAARFRRPLALAPPGVSGDIGLLGAASEFVQYLPEPAAPRYAGATVLLIDERAMSQAEHLGLFLEAANRTTFIGSATAGANGDISSFTVPGGITVTFSGQEVRHADGRPLQRVGLTPHVEVKPTIAGVRAGRDEVLERALEYLGAGDIRPAGVGEAR